VSDSNVSKASSHLGAKGGAGENSAGRHQHQWAAKPDETQHAGAWQTGDSCAQDVGEDGKAVPVPHLLNH